MKFANGNSPTTPGWSVLAGMLVAVSFAGAADGCVPPASKTGAPQAEGSAQAPTLSPKTQQGVDAIHAQDFARAKELLTAARAENPQDPRAAFYLGIAEQSLGNKDGAKKAFREALALDPKLTEASINLSAMLLDSRTQEDAAEAVKVTEAGLQHAPNSQELAVNHAVALADSGDHAAAAEAYGKLLSKTPDDARLRYEYATMLLKSGKTEDAKKELEAVGKSEDPKLLAAAGGVYSELGAFQECIGMFDRAIAKKPTADALVRRGNCRRALRDFKGERADYEEAIKLDDKSAAAHLALGRHLHFVAKKTRDALAELEKAKELGAGTPLVAEAEKTIEQIKHPQRK